MSNVKLSAMSAEVTLIFHPLKCKIASTTRENVSMAERTQFNTDVLYCRVKTSLAMRSHTKSFRNLYQQSILKLCLPGIAACQKVQYFSSSDQ